MYPIREGRRVVSPWTALGLFAVAALPWTVALVADRESARRRCSHPACPGGPVLRGVPQPEERDGRSGPQRNRLRPMLAATPPLLERVLRKFRTGEMPPAGMPRPAAPVAAAFTKSLEESLDRAAAANPNPGRPAVHRLNRAEYSNAIRDVLALDIQPGSALPVDDSGYGFDNIGDVLSMSPALLEQYMSAARHGQPPGRREHEHQAHGGRYLGAPRRSGRRRPRTQRAGQRRSSLRFARRLCAARTTSRWMPNTSSA